MPRTVNLTIGNLRGTAFARSQTDGLGLMDPSSRSLTGSGPTLPSGYSLLKQWDLTRDEGWTKSNKHTNNAAFFTPANVTFGPAGLRLRCTMQPTGGYAYSSGEVSWGDNGFMPDEFYERYVAYMEQPVILGDFPAGPWHTAITGDSNGEIDTWETMANHISGIPGATQTSALGNKVTMIRTPYDANQVSYSKGITETAIGTTEINFCTTPHVFEIFKTLTDMRMVIDGVPMTQHLRGGVGGSPANQNTTGMTNAIWDSQFASGKLWDLRISYQFGDDPDGKPVGSAGVPSSFSGDRYFNVSELLVAVPS